MFSDMTLTLNASTKVFNKIHCQECYILNRIDKCRLTVYNINNMIKSFKHKGLEDFYKTGSIKGIQAIHQSRIKEILTLLNVVKELSVLTVYKLHPLKGNLKGLWAVTVQANWRITFKFDNETKDVYIVDYQDYH